MDCKQCVEDLTAFLDGELSAADSAEVRTHLGACPSCSEELQALREASVLVESHNRVLEPRDGSWNLVRARILADAPPVPSGFWSRYRWRAAVATLAVLAALALGYMQYQQAEKSRLDQYISDYIQQRESQRSPRSVFSDSYKDNPFIDISFVEGSPFQSEAR